MRRSLNFIFAFFGLIAASVPSAAHPMGNFSINHYSRINADRQGVRLTYILDFAEIPTMELATEWGVGAGDKTGLERKCLKAAQEWIVGLAVEADGRRSNLKLDGVKARATDGAGGLPVLRVEMDAHIAKISGSLTFEDKNYPNRTGWKEIVIGRPAGVNGWEASASDLDLSHGLTVYPADLTVTPPQDLKASLRWSWPVKPVVSRAVAEKPVPAEIVDAPAAPSRAAAAFSAGQPATAGTVNRGDFLSRMLLNRRFDAATILLGLLAAFGLGAMHALSPGHGKTIVAAYLVGGRGTLKHAILLGLTVTFTHTISVFLLGLGVLFFRQYIVPERVIPVLSAISGLSIAAIGGWLLIKRTRALFEARHMHGHAHAHHHDHHHGHAHAHGAHHHHDGHSHTHAIPEGRVTLGSLIALGASGGLVPCPSALILLLSAIALGYPGLGLGLLTAFSAGLAVVLMGIGGLVLYAKHLLPRTESHHTGRLVRFIPIVSSVAVIVLGVLMTLTAFHVIQTPRLFS